MFNLYINMGVPKLVDASEEEHDIIDTMGYYLKDNPDTRFMIIESNKDGDWIKDTVIGWIEYATYVEEYNRQLKEKSCVELKSEIVKNVKVKRKGLKK